MQKNKIRSSGSGSVKQVDKRNKVLLAGFIPASLHET